MRRRVVWWVAILALILTSTGIALASSPNYAWTKEFAYLWHRGYVQVKPCYSWGGGYHAAAGAIRYTREAGPPLDTGWLWTARGTGPNDCRILSRTKEVQDSIYSGPQYTTKFNYQFDVVPTVGPW